MLKVARLTLADDPSATKPTAAAKGSMILGGVGGPDLVGLFHNTALVMKALLAQTQHVGNVPIDDLYEHVVKHAVPMEEWPQFILKQYAQGTEVAG